MEKKVFEAGHKRQKRGVCVLRSYAAAVSPYVANTNSDEYIEAYCREHQRGAQTVDEAERLVEDNFEKDHTAKKRNGYEHLVAMHNEGKDSVFKAAANAVTIMPLQSQDPFQEMQTRLRAQPGLTAVMCLLPENEPAHSVALTFDSSTNRFVVSDPNEDFVQECDSPVYLDKKTKQPIKTGTILILEPKPKPPVQKTTT